MSHSQEVNLGILTPKYIILLALYSTAPWLEPKGQPRGFHETWFALGEFFLRLSSYSPLCQNFMQNARFPNQLSRFLSNANSSITYSQTARRTPFYTFPSTPLLFSFKQLPMVSSWYFSTHRPFTSHRPWPNSTSWDQDTASPAAVALETHAALSRNWWTSS